MMSGVDEAELRDTLISEAVVQCCKHSPSWIKVRIMDHMLEVKFFLLEYMFLQNDDRITGDPRCSQQLVFLWLL